jgi:hypothetical protein
MARNTHSIIAAAMAGLLLTGGAAAAQDHRQLAAAAGLSQAEARGLTVPQITERFIVHNGESDGQLSVPVASAQPRAAAQNHEQLAATAGLSPAGARDLTVSQIAERFFAHYGESNGQPSASAASALPRVFRAAAAGGGRDQLIAEAHLSQAQAAGLSLTEIAHRYLELDASNE